MCEAACGSLMLWGAPNNRRHLSAVQEMFGRKCGHASAQHQPEPCSKLETPACFAVYPRLPAKIVTGTSSAFTPPFNRNPFDRNAAAQAACAPQHKWPAHRRTIGLRSAAQATCAMPYIRPAAPAHKWPPHKRPAPPHKRPAATQAAPGQRRAGARLLSWRRAGARLLSRLRPGALLLSRRRAPRGR